MLHSEINTGRFTHNAYLSASLELVECGSSYDNPYHRRHKTALHPGKQNSTKTIYLVTDMVLNHT